MSKLRHIPFKIWFFLFSVILLTTSLVRLPGVGAEEMEQAYFKYMRVDGVGLRTAVRQYHKNVNDIVDKYVEGLFKIVPGEDSEYTIVPPTEEVPFGELCPEGEKINVSTYCLSLELVREYDGFIRALNETHSKFPTDLDEDTLFQSAEGLTEKFAERGDFIDEQIELSRQVMDVTLGVYNEIQIFYPLHVEYQGLIEDLEDYRDSLADIRKDVEKYPGKFIDLTTTDCV